MKSLLFKKIYRDIMRTNLHTVSKSLKIKMSSIYVRNISNGHSFVPVNDKNDVVFNMICCEITWSKKDNSTLQMEEADGNKTVSATPIKITVKDHF